MSVTCNPNKKVLQELVHPKLRKTKICSFFQEGRCRRADKCGFAHGDAELELPPDLSKTSICLAWKEGSCPLSALNCRFAHGKHDLRVFPQRKQNYKSNDDSAVIAPVLPCPPGLQPRTSPPEGQTFLASPEPPLPSSSSDLEPMKVLSASPLRNASAFEPMTVTPSALFSQWGHWESETVTGESNSDDDSSHSSVPALLQSQALLPHFLQSSMGHHGYSPDDGVGITAAESSMAQLREGSRLPELSMFEVELDPPMELPVVARSGNKQSAPSSFERSPNSCPFSSSTKAEIDVPFHSYSAFSGMPRLAW